jgi:predicted P-loop ATPase
MLNANANDMQTYEPRLGLISKYLSIFDKDPNDEITIERLIHLFKGYEYASEIQKIRNAKTKDNRDKLKQRLHVFTISGTFLYGGKMEENLDKPSGMICIDIDGKDNPGTDLNAFALTMRKDPSVIMISKSASGEGLMIIHRIEVREGSAPDDLRLHFFELESIYKESGIVIDDACKNINRLRYATHDPDLYAIEDPHHAEIRPLPKPIQRRDPVTATPTKTPTNLTQTPTTAPDKENRYTRPRKPSVFDYDEEDLRFALMDVNAKGMDVPLEMANRYGGTRHTNWIRMGHALTNFGESGRAYFHDISRHYSNYTPEKTDKKWDELSKGSRGSVSLGSLRFMFRKTGIIERDPRKIKALETAIHHRRSIGTNGGPPTIEIAKKSAIRILTEIEQIPEEIALPYVDKVMKASKELIERQTDREKESIQDVIDFVNSYPLKFNTRTKHLEMDGEEVSNKLTQTISIEAKKEFGKSNAPSDLVFSIMNSNHVPSFDPFKEFLEGNAMHPNQRGQLDEFISSIRIKNDREGDIEFGRILIRKWMIGVISSMMGTHSVLCLVLCGKQSIGKTRFFREMLPPDLRRYYCEDKFDPGKDSYLLMTKKLIICDDEFGGKSKKEAKLFKEILSKQIVSIRKPYDRFSEDLVRLSVFCGTTNDEHILNDPTGNRRILPIHITGIDFGKMDKIDRTGLWIECFRIWKENPTGFFLTRDEINRLEEYGKERFEETSIEKDIISQMFYLPEELDDKARELGKEEFNRLFPGDVCSTSFIKREGEIGNRFQLSPKKIGEQMKRMGFEQTSASKPNPRFMIAHRQRGWRIHLRPEWMEMANQMESMKARR